MQPLIKIKLAVDMLRSCIEYSNSDSYTHTDIDGQSTRPGLNPGGFKPGVLGVLR